MTTGVSAVPCSLVSAAARRQLAAVLAQIGRYCPADRERIGRVVRAVEPLSAEAVADGTMGEWLEDSPSADDPATWGYGTAETPGVVVINERLPEPAFRATLAHELGHACCVLEDVERTNAPNDEWAEEAAADWYAYKWGFGPLIGRMRRRRDWLHHGANPGGFVEEMVSPGRWVRYRLSRRFRYSIERHG
ncbi:ImmA/IrrE family metallo-endopeptidase [Gemmata sp.]|uniref:ImmA/IrrE family metallo-endopeptidase n=1 Tax=Gemmata sp. TaxID=1914242 RepID=UPI003F720FF4